MTSTHPVLHQLAIVRAAREFGLAPDDIDALVLRFPPGSADRFAGAVASALLGRR